MKPDLSSLPEWSRPWAEHRLAQLSHDISGEQWNGLNDWLTALPIERPKMPAKLHKLTIAQALEASVRWHEDIARRAERIRDDQAGFGGDPSAVEVLADGGQGWRWVRVTSPEGLDYEGNAMGHCVGRGNYDDDVTIISLRDKHNMPHCTIEWDEAYCNVKQVQGRANGPVIEKYHESVVSFINTLEPLSVLGAGKFGHVFVEGKLVHCNNLPDGLTLIELDLSECSGLTHLPNGLNTEHLILRGCTSLTHLPNGLNVKNLYLSGCTSLTHLPDDLRLKNIYIMNCTNLKQIPKKINAEYINLRYCTSLTHLPDGLTAEKIDLAGCTGLTHLPDGLTANVLDLRMCTGLTHLPNGLDIKHLDLSGCTGLLRLPDGLSFETLNLSGCTSLTYLPHRLTAQFLDLKDCTGLTYLPNGLTAKVLYLKGCTGLTQLPDKLSVKRLNLSGCTGLTFLPSDLNLDCRVFGAAHLIPRSNPRI